MFLGLGLHVDVGALNVNQDPMGVLRIALSLPGRTEGRQRRPSAVEASAGGVRSRRLRRQAIRVANGH